MLVHVDSITGQRRAAAVCPGRHGANSIIASPPCTWSQCTLHPAPGGQQTTVYKHATTCWVLGGAAADSGWTLLVPIIIDRGGRSALPGYLEATAHVTDASISALVTPGHQAAVADRFSH